MNIVSMSAGHTATRVKVRAKVANILTPAEIAANAPYVTTTYDFYATQDAEGGPVGFNMGTLIVDSSSTRVVKAREDYSPECKINLRYNRTKNTIVVSAPFTCGVVGNTSDGDPVQVQAFGFTTLSQNAPSGAREALDVADVIAY